MSQHRLFGYDVLQTDVERGKNRPEATEATETSRSLVQNKRTMSTEFEQIMGNSASVMKEQMYGMKSLDESLKTVPLKSIKQKLKLLLI